MTRELTCAFGSPWGAHACGPCVYCEAYGQQCDRERPMRPRRTDHNHAELVRALAQCGWRVKDTHTVPGFVDAVVMRGGIIRLVEFKTARGRLTASQTEMRADGWDVAVLRSVDDCVQLR